MPDCPNCSKPYESSDEVCRYCGFILPFSTAVLTRGKLLRQRYEIQGLAHSGGMGYVYFAKDKNLYDRLCVVKQVKEPVKSETDRKRLEQEALRMSKLSHHNAAMILDQFVEGGYYFLVVQHISGKTLSEMLEDRHGQLTEEEVVNWAISMCEVVSYIHSKGVIHRDISPENIMLTDEGSIMFIDFGTMRELRQITSQKTAGIGKFGFTPPEQWQGRPVAHSDIFAIGATIYYLLTEYLPLSSEYQRGQKPQPSDFRPSFLPIREKNPDVSGDLEAVLEKALQLDVAQRYSSAQEVGQALRKAQAQPAAPVQPRQRRSREPVFSIDTAGKKSRKRVPMIIGGTIGALVLLVVSLLAMNGTFTSSPPSPPPPVLHVDRTSIHFSGAVQPDSGMCNETLTVTNTGGGTLTGTVTTSEVWLEVSPTEIVVTDDEHKITVAVDTAGLSYGETYSGYISIDNTETEGADEQIKVTLTTAAAPTTTTTTTSGLPFEDDFSDPNSGWGVGSDDNGEGRYEDGGYRMMVTKADWSKYTANPHIGELGDFSLEVDAKSIVADRYSYYAVMFRQRGDEFYMLAIRSGDGSYQPDAQTYGIAKYDGADWHTLKDWTRSNYIEKGTSTNRLKVTCSGAQITVYVNGHKVATVTDDSLGRGVVALASSSGSFGKADVLFDNLTIYAPH